MIPLCVLSRSAWGEPADWAQPAVALGLAGLDLPFFPSANLFPFFPSANLTFTRVVAKCLVGWEGETIYSYYLFLCGNVWEYVSDV